MALAAPAPSPQNLPKNLPQDLPNELQWKASPRVAAPAPSATAPLAAAEAQPKLKAEPRLAERPSRFIPAPAEADRKGLNALVAKADADNKPIASSKSREPVLASLEPPRLATAETAAQPASIDYDANFIPAPEYDEDHPEELVYRPFPLAPLLTATPSADDAALSVMQSPDRRRTLAMIDDEMTSPPMSLRPGLQMAELLWSKEFRGQAVGLSDLRAERPVPDAEDGLTGRMVKTTSR